MKTRVQKKTQAAERQKFWDSLSPTDKLEDLDSRFGKNSGSRKQRGRLLYEIHQDKALEVAESYGAGAATFAAIRKCMENE